VGLEGSRNVGSMTFVTFHQNIHGQEVVCGRLVRLESAGTSVYRKVRLTVDLSIERVFHFLVSMSSLSIGLLHLVDWLCSICCLENTSTIQIL
jgi:hypothetical protein